MTEDAPSASELFADLQTTLHDQAYWLDRYRTTLNRVNDLATLMATLDPNLSDAQRVRWAEVTDLVDEAFNPRFRKPGDLCGRCGGFGVIDAGTEQRLEDEIVCPECSSGRPDVPF